MQLKNETNQNQPKLNESEIYKNELKLPYLTAGV